MEGFYGLCCLLLFGGYAPILCWIVGGAILVVYLYAFGPLYVHLPCIIRICTRSIYIVIIIDGSYSYFMLVTFVAFILALGVILYASRAGYPLRKFFKNQRILSFFTVKCTRMYSLFLQM